MVKVYIDVESEDLEQFAEKSENVLKNGLNYTAQDFIALLQRESPVDTGLLRQWAVTNSSDFEKEIKSPAAYVNFVNEGTGLYGPNKQLIKPKNGKFLVFKPKGSKTVFARSVKGQKGQHFVENSIKAVEPRIEGYFIRAVNEEGL